MTLAARRVAAHWGIGKMGSGVSKRIIHIVSSAKLSTRRAMRLFSVGVGLTQVNTSCSVFRVKTKPPT